MNSVVLKSAVASLALVTGSAALAQHDHHAPPPSPPAPHDHGQHQASPSPPHDHGQHQTPPAPPAPAPAPQLDPHAGHGPPAAGSEPQADHAAMAHGDPSLEGGHAMTGALGPYPMAREASGTAWQPDSSEHGAIHLASGAWSIMLHGALDLVYSWQEAPRGDDELFPAGMIMAMARRPIGEGTLQFKAMLSPDPLMGRKGYPLLLASGETANGRDPLIDRQHPHDFFMELSASLSRNLGPKTSLFLYGGLPGEPAFGPPAFMHRQSINASPEAPISHHWLDSTHITFGVLTAGLVHDNFKIEVSRFNGREPDEHRWNIETGPLDSTSVRLSWNPAANLSLQGSWAHLEEPEQLEPGVDQRRWSASGTYTRPLASGWWSTTLAWGRKQLEGEDYDAFALEGAVKWKDWTLFGRGEITENNELLGHHDGEEEDHHGEAFRVGKVSLGLVRDFRLAEHLSFGIGGLYAFNFVPEALEAEYGGDPQGAMAFVRLKVE